MNRSIIELRLQRAGIADIAEKVMAGERLDAEEGLRLYQCHDVHAIGILADTVRQRMHGQTTYFNRNMHLNYSNYCALSCKFCAFGKKHGEEGGYRFSLADIRQRIEAIAHQPITEVHIVGGLDSKLPWDYYTEMLRMIKEIKPDIKIKAFTGIEIDFFSRKFKKTITEVLSELQEAGMDTMPGGGAEVFSEDLQNEYFKGKNNSDSWITVAKTAHQMGIKTNCTLLYGHMESEADRINHLCTLREIQDETGGFQAFVPLAFHPDNTELAHLPHTNGVLDLKTMAISRLMLDNIPHIKAYWVMLGTKIAQMALSYGANDVDGTVTEETVVKMAGGKTRGELSTLELLHLIVDAGFQPVERDSVYNVIKDYGSQREESSR